MKRTDGLTDLHCHILPYVDDGAENLEEARAMLKLQSEQGVTTVIATPHCRNGMFRTPPEQIQRQYERLRGEAAKMVSAPALLLGREYYCDDFFISLLRRDGIQPLGNSCFVLMEFSGRYDRGQIAQYLRAALASGFHPVIAHAERYPCLQDSPGEIEDLIGLGAWVQVNAGSVLGGEGWKQKRLCRRWLKDGCVHLVASDSHHADRCRLPNLGQAARVIEKRLGNDSARKVLFDNPGIILGGNEN